MKIKELEQKIEETISVLKNSNGEEHLKVYQRRLFDYVEQYKEIVNYESVKNDN